MLCCELCCSTVRQKSVAAIAAQRDAGGARDGRGRDNGHMIDGGTWHDTLQVSISIVAARFHAPAWNQFSGATAEPNGPMQTGTSRTPRRARLGKPCDTVRPRRPFRRRTSRTSRTTSRTSSAAFDSMQHTSGQQHSMRAPGTAERQRGLERRWFHGSGRAKVPTTTDQHRPSNITRAAYTHSSLHAL